MEFELIPMREFSDIAQYIFGLTEKQIQSISILLSDHFIADAFNFNFFEEIFK